MYTEKDFIKYVSKNTNFLIIECGISIALFTVLTYTEFKHSDFHIALVFVPLVHATGILWGFRSRIRKNNFLEGDN